MKSKIPTEISISETRLNTSCGWFYPAANSRPCGWIRVAAVSSSSGWIQVTADSILQLTQVPAAGYELRLTPSHGWFEFRRLDTSCGWLCPTADSSSGGWIRVAADSVPRLTGVWQLDTSYSWPILRLARVLAAGHDLRLIPSCIWLEFRRLDTSCSWFYPAAGSSFTL